MAQYEGSYEGRSESRSAADFKISGWAIGLTLFASMMMLLMGMLHFISGLAAVLDDSFYPVKANYSLSIDVTTWGWIHLIGGLIVMFAGVWLVTGSTIARIVAIAVAVLSAVGNFYSIPYSPIWSVVLIGLDVAVIWAVCVHGKFMRETDDIVNP
jgi:hypothetical protein